MTIAGTRTAIKTVIRYRTAYLNGKGATLIDGYMEDLATDRIYRVMIAQRIQHSDTVEIIDEAGKPVECFRDCVNQIFDEELGKILADPAVQADAALTETYRQARRISEEMIIKGWFDPV